MEFQEPLTVSHLTDSPQGLVPLLQIKSTSTCTLRVLPPELRIIIYEYLVKIRRLERQTTPALLIALRPDQQLYHEALDVFYKINIFKLTGFNQRGLFAMGNTAIHGIERLLVK